MSTDNVNLRAQVTRGEKTDWFTVLTAELQTTADRTSGDFDHPQSNGLMLQIVLANEAAAFAALPKIQYVDPGGTARTLWTGTSLTAAGTYIYQFTPGGGVNSLITEFGDFLIPRKWRFFLDFTGTPATDKMDTLVYACYL